MNQPEFTVTSVDATDDVTVLTLVGDLDYDTQHIPRAEVDAALGRGRHRIVFDLARMTFCDSSGVGMFIDVRDIALRHGGWIRLAATPPVVMDTFRLLNLDQIFEFHDATDAAVTST